MSGCDSSDKFIKGTDGKSLITSTTDALGNITKYDYTDSTYGIPVSITEYAGTENQIVTNNVLADDKLHL